MQTKINELNAAILAKAAELGLKFVDGPDPVAVDPNIPARDFGTAAMTNGQLRGVYGFAVAEA